MTPDTSNTQVRAVVPSTQAFSEPAAARVEVGHLVHRAAAARRGVHAVTGSAGNDRQRLGGGSANGSQAD